MTLRAGQIERLKKATTREQYPVKKGDYVALITRHIPTATFGGRLTMEPWETFHLAIVTKTNRQGRAVKVRPCGGIQAEQEAFSQFNRVLAMTGPGPQYMARRLAATLDVAENNTFASTDHLRVALRAFSEEMA